MHVRTRNFRFRSALVTVAVLLFIGALIVQNVSAESPYFILKGDLHVHSDFSHDSEVPTTQVVEESGIAGYDFIAITEHNTFRHMLQDYSTEDVLVIAGYEHTTPAAHVNIFGLRTLPKKTSIYTGEEMEAYLAPLREQGAFFQLDHPNDKLYYSRFGYDLDFHFLEILNGVWREDDHQTLKDWQEMLVSGRKLVATGGTDAHKNHLKRGVYNNVYVTEKSEEAILEGLLAGRNFVTVEANGPVISMSVDDVVMGDTVAYRDGQTINITIDSIAPNAIVRVYSNNGLELSDRFSGNRVGSYMVEMSTAEMSFCRVELWFDEDSICAYSNPIYIEH